MTDLEEACARVILEAAVKYDGGSETWDTIDEWQRKGMLAAARAVIPVVLMEAAKMARDLAPSSAFDNFEASVCASHAEDISAAILALKPEAQS